MEQASEFLTVKEAVVRLGLSDKTILKYIKDNVLKAEMRNGKWAISVRSIESLPGKLYGRNYEEITRLLPIGLNKIIVDRRKYEDLLQEVGRLRAKEEALWEYKSEKERLEQRVADLEAELEACRKHREWSGWKPVVRKAKWGSSGSGREKSEG